MEDAGRKFDVAIPTDEKSLAELILKLLGKGRTIGKKLDCTFSIDVQGFANLHYSIHQRVTGQNKSALSTFESLFEFQDGHEYVINSVEQFLNNVFIQSKPCVRARLTWIYIVSFNDRGPERQRIDIEFDAREKTREKKTPSIRSSIEWKVEHTEVTWGYDLFRHIEHFLASHLQSGAEFRHKVVTFLDKHDQTFGIVVFPLVTVLTSFHYWRPKAPPQFHGPVTLDTVDAKMNYLIARNDAFSPQDVLVPMVVALGALFLALYFGRKVLEPRNESSIILNEAMQRSHERMIVSYNRSRCYAALAALASVITGIFGNSIYDYVKFMLGKTLI